MNIFLNLALVVQIVSALALVGVILVQHGQGADMGTGFGSGASGSLFSASGGATFLSHTTAVMATIFLTTTLVLAYFGYSAPSASTGGSVLERAPITLQEKPARPAAEDSSADGAPADAIPAQESAGGDAQDQAPAADADAASDSGAGADEIPAE